MSRTLALMAMMWDPLAVVPRTPLAFLLCNNQPFFQFFDKEMRELGSRRRRLPRDDTKRACQPRLMGDWGVLTGGPSPGCSECIRVRGRRCTHEQPVGCGRFCLNECLSQLKVDGAGTNPGRSACNNVPGR